MAAISNFNKKSFLVILYFALSLVMLYLLHLLFITSLVNLFSFLFLDRSLDVVFLSIPSLLVTRTSLVLFKSSGIFIPLRFMGKKNLAENAVKTLPKSSATPIVPKKSSCNADRNGSKTADKSLTVETSQNVQHNSEVNTEKKTSLGHLKGNFDSTTDKIDSELRHSTKRKVNNEFSNQQNIDKLREQLNIPEILHKKGDIYYSREYSLEYSNIDNFAKDDAASSNFDEVIVGVVLNTENIVNEKTPEQKHVNVGIINDKNQAECFGFLTSSAGHSTKKEDHGIPKNIKLSPIKMDGSFVPQDIILDTRNDLSNNVDFVTAKVPSENRGGQFLQVYKETLKVNPGDYTISSLGTTYVTDTPKVQESLEKVLKDLRINNKAEKSYNPNEKNNDNDAENT